MGDRLDNKQARKRSFFRFAATRPRNRGNSTSSFFDPKPSGTQSETLRRPSKRPRFSVASSPRTSIFRSRVDSIFSVGRLSIRSSIGRKSSVRQSRKGSTRFSINSKMTRMSAHQTVERQKGAKKHHRMSGVNWFSFVSDGHASTKQPDGAEKGVKYASAQEIFADQVWETRKTMTNHTYYWNKLEQQHSWTKPEEMMNSEELIQNSLPWIWIPHPNNLWQPAHEERKLKNKNVSVRTLTGQQLTIPAIRIMKGELTGGVTQRVPMTPLNRMSLDTIHEDLVELEESEINEGTVLHNTRVRYEQDLIYTWIGASMNVILAMNPYRDLGLYTEEYKKKYVKITASGGKKQPELPPPHVYGVAGSCVEALLKQAKSQSILVSGESGSGKTQATRQCLDYITYIAGSTKVVEKEPPKRQAAKKKGKQKKKTKAQLAREKRAKERAEREKAMEESQKMGNAGESNTIENKILKCNAIIEALGNAKTVRNNNSSRFGKWIAIYIDKNKKKVQYAKITPFLLEATRVIKQADNERNYHIFYQIFTDDALREKFKLTKAEDYHYINQGNCFEVKGETEINSIDDAKEFIETKNAMELMGFESDEISWYCQVCAALLHLGNVKFVKTTIDNGKQKQVGSMISEETMEFANLAAELLEIDAEQFKEVLVRRTINLRGEITTVYNTPVKAESAQASLSKAIYSRLFDTLVDRINESFGTGTTTRLIGILDIFGFESFKVNSFEQLCINMTNEILQKQYNQSTYVEETELYKSEKIKFTQQKFDSNQMVLDVIDTKPDGIFNRLDDECKVSGGSEEQLLRVINGLHRDKHKKVFRCDEKKGNFTINHFAGKVVYQVKDFLIKNVDSLNQNLYNICSESENYATKALFPKLEDNERVKIQSTSAKFREQLRNLVSTLSETKTHYIRCIKPNDEQIPRLFNGRKCMVQMHATGILDSIKTRQKGFEHQLLHNDFVEIYSIVNGFQFKKDLNIGKHKHNDKQGICQQIIHKCFREPLKNLPGIQVGVAHVFFRRDEFKFLELNRSITVELIIPKVQAAARRMFARKFYKNFKKMGDDLNAAMQEKDIEKIEQIEADMPKLLGRLGKKYRIAPSNFETAKQQIRIAKLWDPVETKLEKYDDVGLVKNPNPANGKGEKLIQDETLLEQEFLHHDIIAELIREILKLDEQVDMPFGVKASFTHLQKVNKAVVAYNLQKEFEETLKREREEEMARQAIEDQKLKEEQLRLEEERRVIEQQELEATQKSVEDVVPVEDVIETVIEEDEIKKQTSFTTEVPPTTSVAEEKEQSLIAAALTGHQASAAHLGVSSPDLFASIQDAKITLRQQSSTTNITVEPMQSEKVDSLEEFANMNKKKTIEQLERDAVDALKDPVRDTLREILATAVEIEYTSESIEAIQVLLKDSESKFLEEKLKALKLRHADDSSLEKKLAETQIQYDELLVIEDFEKFKYFHRISTLRNPPEEVEYITCFCIPVGTTVREEEFDEARYGPSATHRLDNKKRKFLRWQNHDYLEYSLLRLPKTMEDTCVDVFSNIFGFMENDTTEADEEGLTVIKTGLFEGEKNLGLRNEIFTQIVKQLIENPNPESRIRGVELIGLALATFSPDDDELKHFLISWLYCNLSYPVFRQYMSAMNRVKYQFKGSNKKIKKSSDLSDVRAQLEAVLQEDGTAWSQYSLRNGATETKWRNAVASSWKQNLLATDLSGDDSIYKYDEETLSLAESKTSDRNSLVKSVVSSMKRASQRASQRFSQGSRKQKELEVDATVN